MMRSRGLWLSTKSQDSTYASLVGKSSTSRLRPRPQEWHPHRPAAATGWQSDTSQPFASSAYSAALLSDDDASDDLDNGLQLKQEIELFSSSCLSSTHDRLQGLEVDLSIREGAAMLERELGIEASEILENDFFDDELDTPEPAAAKTADTSSRNRQALQKSAMEILRNFDPQNPPSSNDPEELQLWLECASQREAVLRYQSLLEKARDRKAYDSLSLMQRHIIQWFEDLRDAVEIRQKDYLSNKDKRPARKRYGPFLCSLPPEKMAVIAAHEALTQSLLHSGSSGREGVPLIKIAHAVGSAVETEVISQRKMKERFHDSRRNHPEDNDPDSDSEKKEDQPKTMDNAADRWKFSASHLKMFLADLQRIDPKMGKSKRAIAYAMLRAKQAMDNDEGWMNEDIIHIGAALLSILVEHTKISVRGKEEPAFRVEKKWSSKRKTISYVVLNENLYKMFTEDELASWAATTTRHLPMIVPPTDWTGPKKGGYRWLEADLMRTHGSQVQREALRHGDLSLVYDGLNILGKTAWKINKEILQIGKACWDTNIPIGDIPSRTDLEVPPEPERPGRIPPELYADKESPEAKAAIEANQLYRESMHKWLRTIQKNMVSLI